MTLWLSMAIIGLILLVLLGMGMPIAFTLALLGFGVAFLMIGPQAGLTILGVQPYSTMLSFIFTAIPLFVFLAELLERTGFTAGLFEMVSAWLGFVPGGLAVSAVIGCALFGAVCGSSVATAVVIGLVAIPQMLKRGYDRKLAVGSVVVAGGLGILIPPSIPYILYGAITETSVAKLFISGILPGIMLALMYSTAIVIRAWRSPHLADRIPGVSWNVKFKSLLSAIPLFVVMGIIAVTIYTGIATPTESAAVACFISLLIALIWRRLTWKNLWEALTKTVEVNCFLMALVIGAIIFSYALTMARIPQALIDIVVGWGVSRWLIMIAFQVFLLVLGCFLDVGSCILITIPIAYPIILALGFDPIWFGTVIMINMEMAVITPPVGLNLYAIKGAIPGLELGEIIRGTMPFYVLVLLGLALVMAFPQIALWLPATMK